MPRLQQSMRPTPARYPLIDAILLNPTQEPAPENAASQYVVVSALARCASDTNFDRVCLYLNRLPTEFRVLCVRDATLREPAIRCTAGHTRWAVEIHHTIAWCLLPGASTHVLMSVIYRSKERFGFAVAILRACL